jgi:hypothetical protein
MLNLLDGSGISVILFGGALERGGVRILNARKLKVGRFPLAQWPSK